MVSLVLKISQKILRRSVQLDSAVPSSVLLGHILGTCWGLLRGIAFARRIVVLQAGAQISDSRKFFTGGGLVRLGAQSRIECTSHNGVHVGRNFKLGAFSRIVASGTLSDVGYGVRIGDNVGIGEFAYIGGAGGIEMGSDTIVGQYFSAHPENHIFSDPDLLIREQHVKRLGINIGHDCWIGAKVTVLDGVTVGPHSVIAAGSVVTRSFPSHSVIGGVPARLLRLREDRDKKS